MQQLGIDPRSYEPCKRVTPAQRQVVFARVRGRCEYCHTPDGFVPGSFAVEHIVPRSKGGKTTLGEPRPLLPGVQWSEHFTWSNDFTLIIGLTPRAHVQGVRLNHAIFASEEVIFSRLE